MSAILMPCISVSSASVAVLPTASLRVRMRVHPDRLASKIDDARALGLNTSCITEDFPVETINIEKARRWADENRTAIKHHAQRIKRHGMWNTDLVSF